MLVSSRLACLAALLAAPVVLGGSLPRQGPIAPGLDPLDDAVEQFMSDNGITAGVFGLMRDGDILAQRSYGWLDQPQTIPMPPDAAMRIASITKPITAAAIRKLAADGLLDLDANAFDLGQENGGILQIDPWGGGDDARLEDITVRNLLMHEGGWDRSACVDSNGNIVVCGSNGAINMPDLTYMEITCADDMGIESPPGKWNTMRWILGLTITDDAKGLVRAPGTQYAYSNEGFLALGLIVEAVSGMDYEDYLYDQVLAPIGQSGCDMFLGRTFANDQDPREPWYDGNGNTSTNVYDPDGRAVDDPYGSWDHEARTGQGRIVSSVVPLLHFGANYQLNGDDIGMWLDGNITQNLDHGGSLEGTNSVLQQRWDDDVVFTVIFNRKGTANGQSYSAEIRDQLNAIIGANTIDWPEPGDWELDCNGNGVPDGCEIVNGDVSDADGDMIPDECQLVLNLTQGTSHMTISEAIFASQFGDEIQVPPGVYHESIDFADHVVTLRALTNASETIIDAQGLGRAITIDGGPDGNVIEGFQIINGVADSGGGLYIKDAVVTVQHCLFEYNEANGGGAYGGGGGLFVRDSDSTFHDCAFQYNTVTSFRGGGGVYVYSCSPMFTSCVFRENTAAWGGGADISNSSIDTELTFTGCFFLENTATDNDGGGLRGYGVEITLTNTVFGNNTAVGNNGGGCMLNSMNGPCRIENCTFTFNSADTNGGGLWYNQASEIVDVIDSTFIGNQSGNEAGSNGGAIYGVATTTISGCSFSENTSVSGGAARLQGGPVHVTESSFTANAAHTGGALYAASEMTVTDCTFDGNAATQDGGAIWAPTTVARCVFESNSAARWGGGIAASGAIDACSFINNSGESGGGVMHLTGEATVTNCLFALNDAWRGGGYYASSSADAILVNCTLAYNQASDDGGAIFYNDSTQTLFVLRNSIVWGNTSVGGSDGINVPESFDVLYSNVQDDVLPGDGNVSENPRFESLVGNDYRLSPCSGMIEAGDNTLVPAEITLDLDGNLRIQDPDGDGLAIVDMGAYEADEALCLWTVDDIDSVDVNDLLLLLGAWGQPDEHADLDCSGEVGVDDLLTLLAHWGECD